MLIIDEELGKITDIVVLIDHCLRPHSYPHPYPYRPQLTMSIS
jgi:hypothetical protein